MDAVTALAKSKMSKTQYLIILGAMLLNLTDGYDLSVVGFALPHLPDGFASPVVKGWIVSMGLVGMAFGAIVVAPLADRFGRRPLIISAVVLNMLAVGATAAVPNAELMLATRFFTGVAVGVLGSLSVLIAQEFAPASKRNLATGLVTVGFSIGSLAGGLVGMFVLDYFGGAWQVFFIVGAVLTFLVLIYTVVVMPESLSYLILQDSDQARAKLVKISLTIGLPNVDPHARPPLYAGSSESVEPQGSLLNREFRSRSLYLWFGYMIANAAYYFVATWTPQLITNSTGSTATGTAAGTVISLGSVIGAMVFGIVGMRVLSTKLAWISLFLAMVAQVYFALTLEGGAAMLVAGILGMAAFASLTSFVSSAPQLYPILLRGKGLGYMYGLSRIGAITAPIAAGYAVGVMSPETMFLSASMLFAVAGLLALGLWRTTRTHFAAERRALNEFDRGLEQPVDNNQV